MKLFKKFSLFLSLMTILFCCFSCSEPASVEPLSVEQQQKNIRRCGIAKDVVFYCYTTKDSLYKYKCYLDAKNGTFKFYDKSLEDSQITEKNLSVSPTTIELSGDFIYDGADIIYLKTTSEYSGSIFSEYMYLSLTNQKNMLNQLILAPINKELAVDSPLIIYTKNDYTYIGSYSQEGWNLHQCKMIFEENKDGLHFELANVPDYENLYYTMSFNPTDKISVQYNQNNSDYIKTFGIKTDVPFFIPNHSTEVKSYLYQISLNNGTHYDFLVGKYITIPCSTIENHSNLLDISLSVENNPENEEVTVYIKNLPENIISSRAGDLYIDFTFNNFWINQYLDYYTDGKAVIPYSAISKNENTIKEFSKYTTPQAKLTILMQDGNIPVTSSESKDKYFQITINSEKIKP